MPVDDPRGPASDPFAPDGGTSTILDDRPDLRETEPGDHERFSHYVRKEKVVESAVTGTAVVALCGKVWVPSRDPQRFPVCPECKEIYESLPPGGDGGGSGGQGGSSGGDS
jgi:hypothetical protein